MSNPIVFDPSWLDLENMTPDRWRSLMEERLLQHQDIFVGDFKNKVNEINECLVNNRKFDEIREKLHRDLLNRINKEQFESEYKRFVDIIVNITFEYFCQFIIRNSIDNINNTRKALESSNCITDGVNKEQNSISPKDPELSKQTLILCSPESNTNTTGLNKVILSHMFNNSSQNKLNYSETLEKETDDSTTINKKDEISFHNDKQTHTISNQEHPVGLEMTDELNTINSCIEVQTISNQDHPVGLETTDELNIINNCMDLPLELETTDESNLKINIAYSYEVLVSFANNIKKEDEALRSLAMKKRQQDLNVDSLVDENDDIPHQSNSSEFPTNNLLVLKHEFVNDSFPDDENQISKSLEILQNLVNIEHEKLEVQKCFPGKQEFQLSSNEKKQSEISNNINVKKNKNQKSKEKVNVKSVEEGISGSMERKRKQPVNENKPNKMKKHEVITSIKSEKLTLQNYMNNLSLDASSSNTAIQTDHNNLLTENSTAHSTVLKLTEGGTTVTNNVQIIETPVKCPLEYLSEKNNLLSKELQYTENCTLKVKENTFCANDSNVLPMITYPTPSTSNYEEKNMEYSLTKSSRSSGLTMKTAEYKKLYEKDRKSLFNPDIIIRSNPPKDSILNHCQKKENDLLEVKDNHTLDKNPKPLSFKIQHKNLSDRKKISRRKISCEQKLKKPNTSYNAKIVTYDTTNSVGQIFSSTLAENGRIKFKRLKTERDIDVSKVNAGINENISRITKSSENIVTTENLDMNVTLKTERDNDVSKVNAGINENISRITKSSENIVSTENLDMNVTLKTERDIDVSKVNAGINKNISRITKSSEDIVTTENLDMNVSNVLPNTDILEYNSLPDWLKTKWNLYKMKSSYVVIDKVQKV